MAIGVESGRFGAEERPRLGTSQISLLVPEGNIVFLSKGVIGAGTLPIFDRTANVLSLPYRSSALLTIAARDKSKLQIAILYLANSPTMRDEAWIEVLVGGTGKFSVNDHNNYGMISMEGGRAYHLNPYHDDRLPLKKVTLSSKTQLL